jgi:hypothetical protein
MAKRHVKSSIGLRLPRNQSNYGN